MWSTDPKIFGCHKFLSMPRIEIFNSRNFVYFCSDRILTACGDSMFLDNLEWELLHKVIPIQQLHNKKVTLNFD